MGIVDGFDGFVWFLIDSVSIINGWQCVPVTYFCLNIVSPNPTSYMQKH